MPREVKGLAHSYLAKRRRCPFEPTSFWVNPASSTRLQVPRGQRHKKTGPIQIECQALRAGTCRTKVNQTGLWLPLTRKRQLTEGTNYKAFIHSKYASYKTELLGRP